MPWARLRRAGRIAGVVYGAGGEPVAVSVLEKDVQTALRSGARIMDLRVGGESVTALLKDVDYDHLIAVGAAADDTTTITNATSGFMWPS